MIKTKPKSLICWDLYCRESGEYYLIHWFKCLVINQALNKFHISLKNINVDKRDFRQIHVTRIGKVYVFKVQNKLGNTGCFSLIQDKT